MDLMPGERVIWQGHPTWRAMLAFHLRGVAIAIVVVLVLLAVRWAGVDVGVALIVIAAAIVIGATVLAGWIQRFFTEYAITDKRLHIRRGILSKTESSTNVDRIQNITTFQNLIDRILRCGTLEFDTAGDSDTDEFNFVGVNDPQALRDKIMLARDEQTRESARDPQGGLA